MPRGAKYRSLYGQDVLEIAVKCIQEGQISIRQASKLYHVPRATLYDKLHGVNSIKSQIGAPTVLTKDEEEKLTNWVIHMNQIGYGQTKRQLLLVVKKILDEDGRETIFHDNLPGKDWYRRFLARHPHIVERCGEALGKERAQLTQQKVDKWYDDFYTYMTTSADLAGEGINILADPARIFNADESGFPLSGKTERVLATKGCRNVYQLSNSDRRQITVMGCMSASGVYLPPMLIYPGIRFRYHPLNNAPDDWFIGRSKSGWIDSQVFFEWLANHFLPQVKKQGVQLPVLLLVDGHSSHITLEAAEFCKANSIVLYCFLAHASHIMQPCDLTLFKSVKSHWFQQVKNFTSANIGQMVTKITFAEVFAKAWKAAAKESTAVNGFRAGGICPFTKEAYDRSKLLPGNIFNVETQEAVAERAQPHHIIINAQQEEPAQPGVPGPTDDQPRPPPPIEVQNQILPGALQRPNAQQEEPAHPEVPGPTGDHPRPPPPIEVRVQLLPGGLPRNQPASSHTHHGPRSSNGNENPRHQPGVSIANIQNAPVLSRNSFDKYLRFPQAPSQAAKKAKTHHQALPKAISGSDFRNYLKAKQTEKEKEEQRKRKNREEREAKRLEKEREKKERAGKLPIEEDSDREDEVDTSEEEIDENSCAKCGRKYRGQWEDKNWMGCSQCDRWYHRKCTDIMDVSKMTDDEINAVEWFCPECL